MARPIWCDSITVRHAAARAGAGQLRPRTGRGRSAAAADIVCWDYRSSDGVAGVRWWADFQRAPMDQFLVSGMRAADALAC